MVQAGWSHVSLSPTVRTTHDQGITHDQIVMRPLPPPDLYLCLMLLLSVAVSECSGAWARCVIPMKSHQCSMMFYDVPKRTVHGRAFVSNPRIDRSTTGVHVTPFFLPPTYPSIYSLQIQSELLVFSIWWTIKGSFRYVNIGKIQLVSHHQKEVELLLFYG